MERKPKKGIRLDKWVGQRFPSLTNRQIEEALEQRLIANPKGKRLVKGARVGEEIPEAEISVEKLLAQLEALQKGNPDLQVAIVEETPELYIVDKPAGMASQPLRLLENDTLTHWALAKNSRLLEEFPETQPTLTPHRLDRGTTGLQLVAKSRAAYQKWRDLFQKKKILKTYEAWCWGSPDWEEKEVNVALAHHPKDKSKMVAVAKDVEGTVKYRPLVLEALSHCRVLKREGGRTLIEVTCHTGVTHQVRVHLSFLGFPLVGDRLYDSAYETRAEKPAYHQLRARRLQCIELGIQFSLV